MLREQTDSRFSNGVHARVTLHPQTVTKMSEGRVKLPRKPRRTVAKAPDPLVEAQQFHPLIWKRMLDAVNNDPYRLVAYSTTHLVTLNRPRPRGSSIWDTQYAQPRSA